MRRNRRQKRHIVLAVARPCFIQQNARLSQDAFVIVSLRQKARAFHNRPSSLVIPLWYHRFPWRRNDEGCIKRMKSMGSALPIDFILFMHRFIKVDVDTWSAARCP